MEMLKGCLLLRSLVLHMFHMLRQKRHDHHLHVVHDRIGRAAALAVLFHRRLGLQQRAPQIAGGPAAQVHGLGLVGDQPLQLAPRLPRRR